MPKIFNQKKWFIYGARFEQDLSLKPIELGAIPDLNFIPVLSRPSDQWTGEKGYVQEVVFRKNIDVKNSQVYACGSSAILASAKEMLVQNGLDPKRFFSDAFVATN
jgi:CDP-4-dehydro-6-deoxyglucose reductase